MKKLTYACIVIGLCFSACKKDKDGDVPSGQIPYNLVAPKCLISNTHGEEDGEVWNMDYEYDGQKRVTSITEASGKYKETYTYSGNTMTVEVTPDLGTGSIYKYELNAMGFIEKALEEDSSQVFYTYDKQGYLIRKLILERSGKYLYGISYQYTNGNKTASFNLDVDPQTGTTIDSVLSNTYFYDDNLPGKIEEADAWLERSGRASKNELRSIVERNSTLEYEYTIGDNDLPSSFKITESGQIAKMDLKWKCN